MTEHGSDLEHRTMEAMSLCRSAAAFGLTPEEIGVAVMATIDRLAGDSAAHYCDELAGALARRILEKQRRSDQKVTP